MNRMRSASSNHHIDSEPEASFSGRRDSSSRAFSRQSHAKAMFKARMRTFRDQKVRLTSNCVNDLAKNAPRRKDGAWYEVTILYGKRLTESFILKELTKQTAVPFVPFNFHFDNSKAVFFVDNHDAAMALKACNRKIATHMGTKMQLIVKTVEQPTMNLDASLETQITEVLLARYDSSSGHLDAAKFGQDPQFKSKGIFVPMHRTPVLTTVCRVIADKLTAVKSIDFSYNKLELLNSLNILKSLPRLRTLNLSYNRIFRIAELDHVGSLDLVEFLLKGNTVTSKYESRSAYVSDIRQRFPNLERLDDEALKPMILFDLGESVTLPSTLPSCLPEDGAKDMVAQFIRQYFSVFDSNDRSSLRGAYHDNACFSLSVGRLENYALYSTFIPSRSRGESERRMSVLGGSAIVDYLCHHFPSTSHQVDDFVVDIPILSGAIMQFVLKGNFNQVGINENGSVRLRHFFRVFFVIPRDNGFVVISEMIHVTSASSVGCSAIITTMGGSSSDDRLPVALVTADQTRNEMIDKLVAKFGDCLLRPDAERYLVKCDWDFEEAVRLSAEDVDPNVLMD